MSSLAPRYRASHLEQPVNDMLAQSRWGENFGDQEIRKAIVQRLERLSKAPETPLSHQVDFLQLRTGCIDREQLRHHWHLLEPEQLRPRRQ